jgi:hypothetical protein
MFNQSPASERQYQGIKRTICIGLGGTGRDVLMRVRRLIVDRYKDLSNLPVVSFVHIDTDKEATQTFSLKTGNIYRGVDLGFQDSEKVNATMTNTQVSELVQGLEQCNSNRHQPSPYEHIARWFPPQLLRNITVIDQGAKGVRPVGRLAFFHNYQKIKNSIEIAEQRTRGHEKELLQKFGLNVNPELNIFVVGSLCGGTGSGTFLDVAYSLRHAYPGVQIIGYLVISPELYGNTPNMCANTYAALKELDYYSSPGTQFDACYDLRYLTYVQDKRPPFDFTYLVSKSTEQGNYTIDKQRKLCNVIANKIALEFSSELAPVAKGMRDNFIPHMIQEDDHPRPNSQRYLTFGLAALYFPRDRISQITRSRINSKLVNFWLQGEGQSPDPMKLLEQFLMEARWHNGSDRKDGFIQRLEATALESEKKFTSLMNAWRTKQENSISECRSKDDRSSLMRQLQTQFKEQFHNVKFGETESTRGIWLTKLIKNRTSLISQLQQDIDNYLSTLLVPSNQYFAIANARNWIDALISELNTYQYDLEERVKEANGARNLEELEKKWAQINRTIQDIEEEFKLPVFSNKNSRVQDEARRAVKDTETAIKHNFNLAVAQAALEIVKALQQHIQTRASQLTNLYCLVDDLKNKYEKIQATLKQSDSDEMSGEEIFSDEDIEICANALLPSNEYRAQIVQITQRILEATGSGQSLAVILNQHYTNVDTLKQEIDAAVDRLFGSRSADIVQSVIKRFNQKYPPSERAVRLGQILREAQPLLPLNLTAPYFHNSSAKKSQLIGFKDTDEPEIRQFHTVLTERLAVPDNVLKPTQAEDKVLIVTEYAAFPLRLIEGLKQLKDHYDYQRKHSGSAGSTWLHNDRRDIFTDIDPPDVKMMLDLQDVFYPCLAFDLIQPNQVTQQLEFQYFDELRGVHFTDALSPAWKQALQKLVDNPNMAAALRELRDRAIADIESQPTKWEGYYLPKLRQFVQQVDDLPDDHINYPYRLSVVGSRGTDVNSAREGVINRFRTQMQERVRALPGQNIVTSNTNLPVIAESKKTLNREVEEVEIVEDYFSGSSDNRTRRRLELERLKQDLDDDVLTQEEYEYERQEILNKYPLRK